MSDDNEEEELPVVPLTIEMDESWEPIPCNVGDAVVRALADKAELVPGEHVLEVTIPGFFSYFSTDKELLDFGYELCESLEYHSSPWRVRAVRQDRSLDLVLQLEMMGLAELVRSSDYIPYQTKTTERIREDWERQLKYASLLKK